MEEREFYKPKINKRSRKLGQQPEAAVPAHFVVPKRHQIRHRGGSMMSQDRNGAAELTCVDQDDVVRQKIAKRHTLRLFKRSDDSFFKDS